MPDLTPRIVKVCEQSYKYCASIADVFAALDDRTYASRDDVESTGTFLQERLQQEYDRHAAPPKPSRRARSWWNGACSRAHAEVRKQRSLCSALVRERQEAAKSAGRPMRGISQDPDFARVTAQIEACKARIHKALVDVRREARAAKRDYFESVIHKLESWQIWDAVGWTKPRRLDATSGLKKPDGTPAATRGDLRDLFQKQFSSASERAVDESILDEYEEQLERSFPPISYAEFVENLKDTSNMSAAGPDHLSWFWLKGAIWVIPHITEGSKHRKENKAGIRGLVKFFNACIEFGIFPTLFKQSRTVIIPKPNKPDYTLAKAYRPIVLLNCLGKLLEKIIAKRMQFDAQKWRVMHPCQFGGTLQHSTTDAAVQIVHNVKQAWSQGLTSSLLLMDVSQFFPSINHRILTATLRKQGFNAKLCAFFDDYLVGRETQFVFNGHTMEPAPFSVGVGQGSALSPVLTGLYIAPILHKQLPIHDPPEANVNVQAFVDDIAIQVAVPVTNSLRTQEEANCAVLAHKYHSLNQDLERVGLAAEHDKTELMHFRDKPPNKPYSAARPLGPDIELWHDGGRTILSPKAEMRYLGFWFEPRLSWRRHIARYTAKACSTIGAMSMLGNSVRGFSMRDKRRLYIANVLPIMTYGALVWWRPNWRGMKWALDELQRAQNRAARWISGAFRTTPAGGMEMLGGLLPVRHQINRFMEAACLRYRTTHRGHPIRAHMPYPWQVNHANIIPPFPLKPGAGLPDPAVYQPVALPKRRPKCSHCGRYMVGHKRVGGKRVCPERDLPVPLGRAAAPKPRADGTSFVGLNRETPLTHVHHIASTESTETFDPLHAENRPGDRLVDRFMHTPFTHVVATQVPQGEGHPLTAMEQQEAEARVILTMDHPKKGSPEFTKWLSESFSPRYHAVMHDPHTVALFTDGSQRNQEGGLVSGAAWLVVKPVEHPWQHRRIPEIQLEGKVGGGKRTPFDCEVLAISRGLQAVAAFVDESTTDLVVFVDNEAAIRTSVRPGNGPSSLEAIRSCTQMKALLARCPRLVINFCWFPSHIEGGFGDLANYNARVDALAKEALDEPQPTHVSLAMAQQRLIARAKDAWRTDIARPEYRGHHFLETDEPLAKLAEVKAAKHPFLGWHGSRPTALSARLVRFLTGHFPHGDYRERFNLDGPRNCFCGGGVESRTHILKHCPLWIRWWELEPPEPDNHRLVGVLSPTASEHQLTMPDIVRFVRENWLAGSFELAHLRELVAERQRERGGTAGFSYDECLLLAETTVKVNAAPHFVKFSRTWADPRADPGKTPARYRDPKVLSEHWDARYVAKLLHDRMNVLSSQPAMEDPPPGPGNGDLNPVRDLGTANPFKGSTSEFTTRYCRRQIWRDLLGV